jgi:hypothetical protein
MELGPEDLPEKEIKELKLSNGEGFEIVFEKSEDVDDVRVWQRLYGEVIFLMSIDRHALGDLIYALEDLLE